MAVLADITEYQDLVHRIRHDDAVDFVTVVDDSEGQPAYLTVQLNEPSTKPLNKFRWEWGLEIGLAEITDDGALRVNLEVGA